MSVAEAYFVIYVVVAGLALLLMIAKCWTKPR